MSGITQDRVKTALQAALDDQPGKKDSKWTGSDEAAAMGGVIEFLQNYMKNDGKIEVEGKEKLKGQAARLALTALDFANRCGGLTLTLHEQMAAADGGEGVSKKKDAAGGKGGRAPAASARKHSSSKHPKVRAHDGALNDTLLNGDKLWGRIKYLEEYKIPHYYEDEFAKLKGMGFGVNSLVLHPSLNKCISEVIPLLCALLFGIDLSLFRALRLCTGHNV